MAAATQNCTSVETTLQVYLLGSVEFEAILRLQRRLHFEITGDRDQAALILCEHPHGFTVGRQGSRSQIRVEQQELRWRGWPIRWVNRGGGCMMHAPGQLALYSVLPLDRLGLGIDAYLACLGETIRDLLADFSVAGEPGKQADGIWVGNRMLAGLGVSVRNWVTSFGACVNIDPALDLFRHVDTSPGAALPMTSLVRERGGPVRASLVRERLIEHFRARFGFSRIALFTDHPALGVLAHPRPAAVHAWEGV
ncbi:MAG: lipoyl(octanoyl) transferase [Planctomycetes bacterium]|nr:lipoyl(octanoyl) transferase [Planctomycetota bacterium]